MIKPVITAMPNNRSRGNLRPPLWRCAVFAGFSPHVAQQPLRNAASAGDSDQTRYFFDFSNVFLLKQLIDRTTHSIYIGVEIDSPIARKRGCADLYYNGTRLPVDDGAFDAVLMSQVFEHVFNPEEVLREVWRILRADGMLIMSVPFVWDEHEQPYDYARYSSFGLCYLLEKNGFAIVLQRKTLSDIRIIFQLINAYIYKVTSTKSRLLNLIAAIVLMAPATILGATLYRFFPKNNDLFLDNIVLARKKGKDGI